MEMDTLIKEQTEEMMKGTIEEVDTLMVETEELREQ